MGPPQSPAPQAVTQMTRDLHLAAHGSAAQVPGQAAGGTLPCLGKGAVYAG